MGFILQIPKMIRWVAGIMLLILVFMTIYRFIFFYSYRPEGRPFPGSAFLLGMRYDLRIVCIAGLFLLLLSYLPYLNPFRNNSLKRLWLTLCGILFFIILLVTGTDFYHYDYLHQRLSASVLNFLEDAAISFNMMWQTYPLIRISLMVILFVTGMVWLVNRSFKKINTRAALPRSKKNSVFHLLFILLCGVLIFGQLGQYPLRWSDAFRYGDDFKANVALNPFQSFFSTLKFKNSSFDREKVRKYYPVMAEYLGVQQTDSVLLNYTRTRVYDDSLSVKPNVVIILCESFSAYKSSMFGNKLDPTPYFRSLCDNGVFFERCFVPSFGTARGVWALLTGIPDVEHPKTASRNPMAVDQHTIMNDFSGYEKFYFLGGSTTWANIRGVLTNNITGLTIYEEENFKSKKVDVWGISDKNLFLEANQILSKTKKPFISIIQTADNHRPYTIPDEDKEELKRTGFPDDTLTKYGFTGNDELNAFRYMDFCIRKFMEAAQKEEYYNNTIFIFVGDHGLRGDAGSMFPQSFTKQGILAQHVPLLFYGPAFLKPRKIRTVSSQLDILPTAASIANVSYSNTTFGRNLFDSSFNKNKYAFIADPDIHTIGVVSDQFYYRKNLDTRAEEFVSVTDDLPPQPGKATDSSRNYMRLLTDAWYETARYILLNNKKKIKE